MRILPFTEAGSRIAALRLGLTLLICSTPVYADKATSLFDGKTLKGWHTVERDAAFWSVKDGAITADSLGKKMPRNTFLFSDEEYGDFEFSCKFRLSGDPKTGLVNSGIQFRTEKLGKGNAKGYQADIGEPKWWGCLYDEHRRGLIAKSDVSKLRDTLKPFGWNDYRIVAIGPEITLFINGIQTIHYTEKDADIPAKGHFALQLHSGAICRIEYKDIQLTPRSYHAPEAKNTPAEDVQIFEDFELGTYNKWNVEGDTFGAEPVRSWKMPDYQGQVNAEGKFLVNSHASATGESAARDAQTGKMTSNPFTISHDYVRLRIGGGAHKGKTCVNLLVENKQVASLTGDNSNSMRVKYFDTKAHKGKKGILEIVDNETGGWGNIGVDEIVFTNHKSVVKPDAKAKPKPKKPRGSRSVRTESWTPEAQRAGFKVPEGFKVELVASEENGVINPIDISFDDAGRLWTGTGSMYPLDPDPEAAWKTLLKYMDNPELAQKDERFRNSMSLYSRKTKGTDRILVFDDLSEPSSGRVWADGMAIPQSILPYKNGAYVAHGSEMLYLEDTDQDGKADKQTSILNGYGFSDTHTMSHLLVRAPGGWVHYAHGALNKGNVLTVLSRDYDRVDYALTARFSLNGKQHNVVTRGLNNIWGYQLRASGQWYGQEANDKGHSVTPMESGTAYNGIGNPHLRPYQPKFPPPNKFRVGGTGLSGLAFADDRSNGFPEEFRGVAFLANPITCKINAARITRNPDGSVSSEHLPDFLTSEDDWFRPVNIEFGPDGCLYIADFYNKIISHNEVSRSHPDRDKTHGRIWRIRYKDHKGDAVNVAKAAASDLPRHLKSGTLHTQRSAWRQIVDRNAQQLVPDLIRLCADSSQHDSVRIHALWSLEGLKRYDAVLMNQLLSEKSDDVKREAVRALANMPVPASELATMLSPLVNDSNAMIRSQVLRTLADYGQASAELIDILVSACKPDSSSGSTGGGYERKFERYLARMTLEQYPEAFSTYLDSTLASKQPDSHIEWASQALSLQARAKAFLASWEAIKDRKLTEDEFRELSELVRDEKVRTNVQSVFVSGSGNYLIEMALRNPQRASSVALITLMKPVCEGMLKGADPEARRMAAQAVAQLSIPGLDDLIAESYDSRKKDPFYSTFATRALSMNPQKHSSLLSRAIREGGLSTEAALSAYAALASVDPKESLQVAPEALKAIPDDAHEALAHQLVKSSGGSLALLSLIKKGRIHESIVDRTLVEAMSEHHHANKEIKKLSKRIRTERSELGDRAAVRIEHLAKLKKGDADTGKTLFKAMCLSCHSLGGSGAGFAPALDGSGYRDTEALLTAIVNPDAAAEGNYTLYRIFKTDGAKVEGYLESETAAAVRLRFMGGGSMDIPRETIASSGFVAGKSVMPTGLTDGLDDSSMSDLLAYIRSLK